LNRGWPLAALAALALIVAGAGEGAVTRIDPYGTTLLDGRKVFPIVLAKGPELGAETPGGGDAVAEVVGAGVNFLKVGPATVPWTDADVEDALAWNREAAEHGAYTWVNLATLSTSQPGSTRLREVVTALKEDVWADAIGLWKGADEPLWVGTGPEELRYAYCLSTSRGDEAWCGGDQPVDSEHLWVTIQAPRGTAAHLAGYSAVTDVHGIDVYPVTLANPDGDLHRLGTWTDTIRSVTPNRAVWSTLQICASGSGDGEDYVLPSRLQERYMIYDAIINGARSLAFYGGNIYRCWDDRDDELLWNWRFWDDVLEELVREINAVSPLAPALVNPETTQVLASSDATTQVISRKGATEDDVWVIAARHGEGPQAVTISGLPARIGTGTVYTEGRSVAVQDGSFTDTFERWGVHVYHFRIEPPPPPPPAPPPAPPPPPQTESAPPPAAPVAVRTVLLSRGLTATRARAGRLFTVRLRVATSTGARVGSAAVRCPARVGKSPLRPLVRRWSRGVATCTWRLPRAARAKRVLAGVRVQSRGSTVAHSVTRRISR
jgi:hypothetical protein